MTRDIEDAGLVLSAEGSQPEQVSQSFLDALPVFALLIDEDHRIQGANAAARERYEISDRLICGEHCALGNSRVADASGDCLLAKAMNSDGRAEAEVFDAEYGQWLQSSIVPMQHRTAAGRRVFLHLARDITAEHNQAAQLSQSLEHHKSLGQLLERLQSCQQPEEVLDALVDQTLSLSWLRMANAASGLLMVEDDLRIVVARDVDPDILAGCACVPQDHCLCGKVAKSRRTIVADADALREHHGRWHQRHPTKGHAIVPLLYEDRTLGVLNIYLEEGALLEPVQIEYLEAAASVAAASLAEQAVRAEKHTLERQVFKRILQSMEDERKRLSLELHDDVGQALSSLLMEVRKSGVTDESTFSGFRSKMEGRIEDLIKQVSSLAWELRPSILDDHGLDFAIERHTQRLAELSGLKIDFQYVCPRSLTERLPSEVEVVLYRVSQEALNNVIRHAKAKTVSVILVRLAVRVALLVEDDGQGFDTQKIADPETPRGLGLEGMSERIALVDGEFLLESEPGQGTTVRATIELIPRRRGARALPG